MISHFVDHPPYYWLETVNARSGVYTPRSALAQWSGRGSAGMRDGRVPIDNNHLEGQIRPWAMGRRAWLFAGSQHAGQRAAIVMSLLQSARLNGYEPHAYLSDVLERLPSHPASRIEELLPHRWKPR